MFHTAFTRRVPTGNLSQRSVACFCSVLIRRCPIRRGAVFTRRCPTRCLASKEYRWLIPGIKCGSCANTVERVTAGVQKFDRIDVNPVLKQLTVVADDQSFNEAKVVEALAKAGYPPQPLQKVKVFRLTSQQIKCSACVSKIEKALLKDVHVDTVSVNPLSKEIRISAFFNGVDEKRLLFEIQKSLRNVGFETSVVEEEKIQEGEIDSAWKKQKELSEIALTAVLTAPLLVCADLDPMLQAVLGTSAVFVGGRENFQNAFRAGIKFNANMDTLIAVGVGTSVIHGLFSLLMGQQEMLYFEPAALITSIVRFGRHVEARGIDETRKLVSTMLSKMKPPLQARVIFDRNLNDFMEVPVTKLVAGDVVLVKTGEEFPCDGVLRKGTAWVDESMITGEPLPVAKYSSESGSSVHAASRVIAGTVLVEASESVFVEATEVGDKTFVSSLKRKLEQLSNSRTSLQRIVDQIAGYVVPAVLMTSFSCFLVWNWIFQDFEVAKQSALAVLVGSCPCALGLATPTAILVGISVASKNGIAFQTAQSLERAGSVKILVFDKTGTLTFGKPKLTQVSNVSGRGEVSEVFIALAKQSSHVLDYALVTSFADKTTSSTDIHLENVVQVPGYGIKCSFTVESDKSTHTAALGSMKFMRQEGCDFDESLLNDDTKDGSAVSFGAVDSQVVVGYRFEDTLRTESKDMIHMFKNDLGVDCYIASGDNSQSVRKVASLLDIPSGQAIGDLLPEDKARIIQDIRTTHTAKDSNLMIGFVGDGVNDLLSLRSADVGFGFGSNNASSAAAVEASDVAILGQDLKKVHQAYLISRAVRTTIFQNLAAAFAYNAVTIPLAISGSLPPSIAASMMALSSISVVGNALRLKWTLKF
jgi:Cu+-exporting ATPase